MKRMIRYLMIPAVAILMISCDSNTYEDLQETVPVEGSINYTEHIQPIIAANCLHCHGEGGVSEFRPLGTYAHLKEAVLTTNLLDRIQRQNGEAGQMPADGRMPMSDIQLILQWNEEGLMEN
jgi:mono/diheme cytochrome c family protein